MKMYHMPTKIILTFVIFSITVMVGYGYGYGGGGSSSGGSNGGSRVITTSNIDPYSNIFKYEVVERNLIANQSVEYPFITQEFGIYQILVNGKENEYSVPIRIEDLKNTSIYAKKSAPGIVYKDENVWLGSGRIKYISVRIRVNNSWLENNSIDDGRIPYLLKWDGTTWLILKTNITGKDDTYTYLESSKAGNSRIGIFAISVPIKRLANMTLKNATISVDQYEEVVPEIEETEITHKNAPGFDVITIIIGIIIYMTRKETKR